METYKISFFYRPQSEGWRTYRNAQQIVETKNKEHVVQLMETLGTSDDIYDLKLETIGEESGL